ncbi:MAG: hypothetical protein ACREM6_16005, partial [Vulcanimicrobiaceae bacterium]
LTAVAMAALVGYSSESRGDQSSKPSPSPTSLSISVVNKLCVDYDLHLDGYVYYDGYLFCQASDENTEGQGLFKETEPGVFTFVRGGGGAYRAKDLVKLAHVPPHIAHVLVERLKLAVEASSP